ncbi:hypothetical protein GQX74_013258 [Glossina fuscipes]|nr:hypothetical protein GQX74_013258 [Glossina fuscipes]
MAAETGGIKRKLPTGGEAYGIPRYASTGSKWRPSNCTITPDKAPLRVCIMRDESCAGNDCGSIQNTCNENPEEGFMLSLASCCLPYKHQHAHISSSSWLQCQI